MAIAEPPCSRITPRMASTDSFPPDWTSSSPVLRSAARAPPSIPDQPTGNRATRRDIAIGVPPQSGRPPGLRAGLGSLPVPQPCLFDGVARSGRVRHHGLADERRWCHAKQSQTRRGGLPPRDDPSLTDVAGEWPSTNRSPGLLRRSCPALPPASGRRGRPTYFAGCSPPVRVRRLRREAASRRGDGGLRARLAGEGVAPRGALPGLPSGDGKELRLARSVTDVGPLDVGPVPLEVASRVRSAHGRRRRQAGADSRCNVRRVPTRAAVRESAGPAHRPTSADAMPGLPRSPRGLHAGVPEGGARERSWPRREALRAREGRRRS